MQLSSYLAGFVSIVLALALSDMVQSTHRLLRARAKVVWDVWDIRPVLAAIVLFLSVLSEFFAIWGIGGVGSFNFFDLIGLMATPTLLSLAALAVLPDEVPEEGLDLGNFYLANHVYLYVVFALAFTSDFLGNVREVWVSTGGNIPLDHRLWWFAAPVESGIVLTCVVLAWSRNRWVHLIGLACLLAIAFYAYSTWQIQFPSVAATTPG